MNKFDYPPVGFRFSVTIGAFTGLDASFVEVSGISAEVTTEEVVEGGENRFKHRLPLQVSYPPLVLKRGVAGMDSPLLAWVQQTLQTGYTVPIVPQNVVVTLLGEKGFPLTAWTFEGAYPIKYEVSGLKADSNQIAIESIELNYRRFVNL